MEFVTEAWQPLNMNNIRLDGSKRSRSTYELRHWLAFTGLAFLLCAPFGWVVWENWAPAAMLASIGLLLVSAGAILVPDLDAEHNESREDRRGIQGA